MRRKEEREEGKETERKVVDSSIIRECQRHEERETFRRT